MNPHISLTSAFRYAPGMLRRWVVGATLLAVLGYGVFFVLDLVRYGLFGAGTIRNGTMMVLTLLSAAVAARGNALLGGGITLSLTWFEVISAFRTNPDFPSAGVLVLPVLLLGFGLLLGARAAFVVAVITVIATTITHLASPPMQATGITTESIYFFAMHAVSMIAAWALLAMSLSGFQRVFDQMVANERDLADTIRFAPDGILVVDATGHIVLSNPAAESLLCLTAEQMQLRKICDVLASISGQRAQLDAIAGEKGDTAHELSLTAPGGLPVHLEAAWHNMEGGRRQLLLRDITPRVRAEEERRAMQLQLSHAQRLDAVGRLAGGLSHDFNNILTAVSGSAEMLRLEQSPTERAELISEIIAARDRGVALTRQLLTFARREVTQPRVLDLALHIRGMQRLLQRVAGDRNQLCLDLAEGCRVRVDPGQLEQAVVNLVANAADAMPDGGRCTITVERVPTTGTPLRVLLHVADTGVGMHDDIAARAFEPFFTTKPRGQGTGLGLASVHGMAQQSDGNASVRSVPGTGTCVTIDLPWTDEPAAVAPTATITAPMKTGPYTILLAEDDNGTRRVVERILVNAGYVVHNAADGAEAMAMIEDASRTFDLFLSDVMMPGHTGPELADRLAILRPQTPVLLMTGYAEEQLEALLDTSVKREIITKPFSAEALTSRVASLLRTLTASGSSAH